MAVKYVFKEIDSDSDSTTKTGKTLTFNYDGVPLDYVLQGITEFLKGCGYTINGNLIVDEQ